MKIAFIISLCITLTCLALIGASLVDIVSLHEGFHDALGPTCLVALAVCVKTYIHLKKRTR